MHVLKFESHLDLWSKSMGKNPYTQNGTTITYGSLKIINQNIFNNKIASNRLAYCQDSSKSKVYPMVVIMIISLWNYPWMKPSWEREIFAKGSHPTY